jgi:tetraacyldisaccharide 4'-kinase
VAVGNLTFGGTGKTPFTEFLARRFRFEGRRPAILSRGYGRRTRGVVVVSAGNGPIVSPEDGGDEPVAMARSAGPGMIVVVGERRADAARRAAELGADLLLLDDAFQHLAVRRDVNLLLVDSRDPFGGGRLPPSGRLRSRSTRSRARTRSW